MKILRKYLLNFMLIFMVAICPIVLAACSFPFGDTTNNNNFGKAIGAAVDVLKANSQTPEPGAEVSTLSLNYEEFENQEEMLGNLFLLDYMKETGKSKGFDFPETAFKATMLEMEVAGMDYSIYGIHKYSIDGNNISAEMVFSYIIDGVDYGFEVADYEKINVEYDFDTDTLISFDWISCPVEWDTVYHFVYENETLKYLADDSSSNEYTSFLSQVVTDAEELFNTETLASKVYDFKSGYRTAYYNFNGVYPEDEQYEEEE